MSTGIVAQLRAPLDRPADFSEVFAGEWHAMPVDELAARPVHFRNDSTMAFGDLFDVRGTGDGTIRLIGDLRHAASLGAGMNGGEIIVEGALGNDAGARMRRGTIAVTESVGPRAGVGAIAGSVIVFGTAGREPGLLSKRGSVVALGGATPPPTYRWACTYRPPHLRLALVRLRQRFGLVVTDRHLDGTYDRYSGDFAELGRGEILLWKAP